MSIYIHIFGIVFTIIDLLFRSALFHADGFECVWHSIKLCIDSIHTHIHARKPFRKWNCFGIWHWDMKNCPANLLRFCGAFCFLFFFSCSFAFVYRCHIALLMAYNSCAAACTQFHHSFVSIAFIVAITIAIVSSYVCVEVFLYWTRLIFAVELLCVCTIIYLRIYPKLNRIWSVPLMQFSISVVFRSRRCVFFFFFFFFILSFTFGLFFALTQPFLIPIKKFNCLHTLSHFPNDC